MDRGLSSMLAHASLVMRLRRTSTALLLVLALTAGPASAAGETAPSAPPDVEPSTPPAMEVGELGGTWRRMAPAPFAAPDASGGWTGSELIVVDPKPKRRAAAYDPSTDTWRKVARPPWKIAAGSPAYWTGMELIFVERRGSEERGLAAYDPVADAWHTTAPAPMGDIAASVWADDVLVVHSGSDLAAAAYDPALDAWTELAPTSASEGLIDDLLSLHWTGEQVLALVTTADGAEPMLAFVPLDLGTGAWGVPSIGPLLASASPPLWTGDSFVFLTDPADPAALGEGPRDGSYDPATDTWALSDNHCGLDSSEAVRSDSLVIGMPQRRALDSTSGQCDALPLPPWAPRNQALRAWTGAEVLEFSGATAAGLPARRDGLAYSPLPAGATLGVAVDKPSRPVRIRVPSLGIDLPVISDERRVKGSAGGYPACDVALYWSYFDLPGEPGTTWILAHAQQGMFLPLLQKVRARGAKSLLGRRVELQLRDGRLFTYRIHKVKPRSDTSDLSIARKDRTEGEQRLVLQTSTGTGSAPKLEVGARLVDVATTDQPRPKPKPRACG